MGKKNRLRLWELDAFRGIAILGMISFHFLFDLKYFGIHPSIEGLRTLPEYFWDIYSSLVAWSFLILVGISATVRTAQAGGSITVRNFRKPALRVLAAACIVTAISLIFNRELPIYFGVLHCIGVSLFLLPFFLPLGKWNYLWAALIYVVGKWMNHHPVHFKAFIWLGLKPHPMPMGDYFPLLPWTAIILLGIAISSSLRLASREHWLPERWQSTRSAQALGFLGRHSLLIYLVHQPILLALASIVGLTRFPH